MTESGAHISAEVTIRGSSEAVEKAKKQILAITEHCHTLANEEQSFFENHKASRHPWHRSSEDQSQTDLPNGWQIWKGAMLPPDENWDHGQPDRSTFYIKDSGESLKEIPKNGWDDPQEEGQGGSQQEYSSWDSEHREDKPCHEEEWQVVKRKRRGSSGGRDAGTAKKIQCFRCYEYGHVCVDCPTNRGNRDVTCYKCGNAGHISRNCTNNNSQKKEPIKPANQRMVDRYGPRPQQGSGQSG